MAVSVRDIPRLTGMNDYPAWKTGLSAAFLILDLSSAINPPYPTTSLASTLPPDPLPFLFLSPNASPSSPALSEQVTEALSLLRAKKQQWESAHRAEEAKQQAAEALLEKEKKRKDDVALGWIFLTIEKTLAQELLLWCGKKRGNDGEIRKAELRELNTRMIWEKLQENLGPAPDSSRPN